MKRKRKKTVQEKIDEIHTEVLAEREVMAEIIAKQWFEPYMIEAGMIALEKKRNPSDYDTGFD